MAQDIVMAKPHNFILLNFQEKQNNLITYLLLTKPNFRRFNLYMNFYTVTHHVEEKYICTNTKYLFQKKRSYAKPSIYCWTYEFFRYIDGHESKPAICIFWTFIFIHRKVRPFAIMNKIIKC